MIRVSGMAAFLILALIWLAFAILFSHFGG
jgi:hypothetical protein